VRVARLAPSRRVWIFDLDNTLHDAAARIFPSMHEQINAYLKRHFGVDDAGADAMRRSFWLRYGTTLKGLMRHHGTDPGHFLRETHRFPELADMVVHIDDALDNLRTAHRLGMSTVWVSRDRRRAPFVDFRVRSVIELPRLVFR